MSQSSLWQGGKAEYGKNQAEQPTDSATVKQLLTELSEAEATSKTQTARDLRNKLNDVREKLGDEKFKETLNELIKDPQASEKWLEYLRALMKLW
ncbi:hypothetical protein GIR22_23110, partial [Pseudomonas sp. CCM 7891]|nr:hypothetical protein [Pseudomonas karstica]